MMGMSWSCTGAKCGMLNAPLYVCVHVQNSHRQMMGMSWSCTGAKCGMLNVPLHVCMHVQKLAQTDDGYVLELHVMCHALYACVHVQKRESMHVIGLRVGVEHVKACVQLSTCTRACMYSINVCMFS